MVTIIELFNHTHINWVGANVAHTETKFFNNINSCFLKKLVRGQKETNLTLGGVTIFRKLLSKAKYYGKVP